MRAREGGRWRLAKVFSDRGGKTDGGKHAGHTN